MGIGRPPAPIDIPDDEIEVRFQIAKAALRGRYHVDAWAQRGSKPLGCRLEDWAPSPGELITQSEAFPHRVEATRQRSKRAEATRPRRVRRKASVEWARGVYHSRRYGTITPQRMKQTA